MSAFDLPGVLRRIRRTADLSQRELAAAGGLSASAIGHAESGARDLPVRVLARLAALAELRLAVLDAAGAEVSPMSGDAVRDMANRRFPAHLDTRYGDEDWWHGEHRYEREQPWYTFDRLRYTRDRWRGRTGTPEDHQLPRSGDSPRERAAARQRASRLRWEEERARRLASWKTRPMAAWTCTCPPKCDELDDFTGRPVHVEECPCSCDVG
jgi:transcriptional regulator with XRE-family HTH domain